MDLNNLDKGDLNDLQNFEMNFDKDAMWSKLEKRNNNRALIAWLFRGGALICLIALIYSLVNHNITEQQNTLTEQQHNTEYAQKDHSQSDLENDLVVQAPGTTISNAIDIKKKVEAESVHKKLDAQGSTPVTAPAIGFSTISEEDHSIKQNNRIENLREETRIYSQDKNVIVKAETKASASNSVLEKDAFKDSYEAIIVKGIDRVNPFAELPSNRELPTLNLSIEKVLVEESTKFLLTPFIGVGYAFNSRLGKARELITSPSSLTSQFESISGGLLFDIKFKNDFIIGTGIEYIQHNEQLEIYTVESGNINSFQPEEIPENYFGQEGFLTKRTTEVFINRHRLVNIPLTLSLLMQYGKLRVAPSAGVVFNLSYNASGFTQDLEETVVDIDDYFRARTSLGYRLGCRLYHPLNNNTLIFVNPKFEINPSDITTEVNPVMQQRNLATLNIGLTMTLKS